jgi:VWFA-related protein
MMTRSRCPVEAGLIVLFWIFLSPWLLGADDNGNPTKYLPTTTGNVLVLKKTVRRVVVDVVVRGADGKPVRGLRAEDFSVIEDGQKQPVLSFDVHEFDRGSLSIPANAPALPANVFVNVPRQPEKGPLFVLLLDMANTEDVTDQIIARQQAVKFISNKPEGTRFAVFLHYDGLKLIQGFTADKNVLYAALDPKNSKSGLPKAFLLATNFHQGSDATIATVSAITHLAQFLNGIPGRKNIMWMSAKFPVSIYAKVGDPMDRQVDVRKQFNELTRAQIAVYPLNVRGVILNPEGRLTGGGPHTGVGGAAPTSPAAGAVSAGAPAGAVAGTGSAGDSSNQEAVNSTYESAYLDDMMSDDIASSTGGRAFYSTNDLAGALDEIVEDGSNYYTLTYSPSNPSYDGSLRKIRVLIEGHKYKLEYRRSYYADDPELEALSSIGKKADDDSSEMPDEESKLLLANLRHGAPMVHQLIFKTRIHPLGTPAAATPEQMAVLSAQPGFAHGKKKKTESVKPALVQTYAVYYALVGNQVKSSEDGTIPLEFAAAAYDSEGWVVNSIIQKTQDASAPPVAGDGIPLSPGEAATGRVYRAMQELVVPLTATSIRVAVRDLATDRVGALEVALPLAPENASTTASAKPSAF